MRRLNPCCVKPQRASVFKHKEDCWRSAARRRQTGFTSRLMMIAFINNVSVWGRTKCSIHVLRRLEGNTDSFSMAEQKKKKGKKKVALFE